MGDPESSSEKHLAQRIIDQNFGPPGGLILDPYPYYMSIYQYYYIKMLNTFLKKYDFFYIYICIYMYIYICIYIYIIIYMYIYIWLYMYVQENGISSLFDQSIRSNQSRSQLRSNQIHESLNEWINQSITQSIIHSLNPHSISHAPDPC